MKEDNTSKYKIKQSKKLDQESKNSWNWSIWIDAEQDDLKEISEVVYILHPTFRNRVRTITSAKNKFKLSSTGWGEFTIFIRIYFKDEDRKPLYLSHNLILFSDENKAKKKIFISSQIKDKETTEDLVSKLKENNFDVATIEDLGSSQSISSASEDSLEDVETIVVVGSELSRYQEYELSQAMESDKKIFILSDTINNDFQDIQHIKSSDELLNSLNVKK